MMISSKSAIRSGTLQVSVMEAVIPVIILLSHFLHPIGCNTPAVGGDLTSTSQGLKNICSSCKGDNSTCRAVSGIFSRPQLNVGYNLVAHIPKGACNLSITEIRKSPNHLALQRRDGSFILNGDWRLSPTGDYYDSGTLFQYKRQDLKTLESVISAGPTQDALDLMVLYQQPNPVIKYEYLLPQQSDGFLQDSQLQHLRQPEAATSRPTGYSPFPAGSNGRASSNGHGPQALLLQHPQQHPSLQNPYNSISSFPTKYNQFEGPTPTGNALYPGESPGVYNNPYWNGRRRDHGSKLNGAVVVGNDKKFYWKISGYTNCSEPCGGGVQIPVYRCVRGSVATPVSERRCDPEEKPASTQIRCNLKPCPAEWVIGEWSNCNAECGEGHKSRSVHCQQRVSPTLTMKVAEGACLQQRPQAKVACELRPCNTWRTTEWSQCSAKCGSGVRKRRVACLSLNGQELTSQECQESERPPEITPCNMGPCEGVDWFVSEWSPECSQKCGSGIQTRHVVCSSLNQLQRSYYSSYLGYSHPHQNISSGSRKFSSSELETNVIEEDDRQLPVVRTTDEYNLLAASATEESQTELICDENKKPAAERECFSEKNCGEPIWFAGDWSQCSVTCGSGLRTRQVLCVQFARGKFKVTSENVCSVHKKPAETEECDNGIKCPQRWFTTEWGDCTALCGGGLQKRGVSCRASNWTLPSSLCYDKDRPVERQYCNEQKCTLAGTAIPSLSSRNSGEMVRDKPISFRPYTPSPSPSLPTTSVSSPSPFDSVRGSQSSYETSNDLGHESEDATCTDQYRNCGIVVRARLCRYKYYKSVCCAACALA